MFKCYLGFFGIRIPSGVKAEHILQKKRAESYLKTYKYVMILDLN